MPLSPRVLRSPLNEVAQKKSNSEEITPSRTYVKAASNIARNETRESRVTLNEKMASLKGEKESYNPFEEIKRSEKAAIAMIRSMPESHKRRGEEKGEREFPLGGSAKKGGYNPFAEEDEPNSKPGFVASSPKKASVSYNPFADGGYASTAPSTSDFSSDKEGTFTTASATSTSASLTNGSISSPERPDTPDVSRKQWNLTVVDELGNEAPVRYSAVCGIPFE